MARAAEEAALAVAQAKEAEELRKRQEEARKVCAPHACAIVQVCVCACVCVFRGRGVFVRV